MILSYYSYYGYDLRYYALCLPTSAEKTVTRHIISRILLEKTVWVNRPKMWLLICHFREGLFHKVTFYRMDKYEYKSIDKLLIYTYNIYIAIKKHIII